MYRFRFVVFFFYYLLFFFFFVFVFFQAEDGIRDLVRSRGLGDVYKRQVHHHLRRTLELLAQFGVLRGNTHRARVLVANARHGAALGNQHAGAKLSLIHI